MPLPIVKADIETRVGAGEVVRFSRGSGVVANETNVSDAIEMAWSKARSAALNVFSAASWDALTADTLPGEAKYHIVSDACDILSAGNKRPDEIQTKADEAKQWRSWLAGDTVRCFDGVLTKLGGVVSGADRLRMASPATSRFSDEALASRHRGL